MAWEADRLDTAARALQGGADRLDGSIRRLRWRLEQEICQGARGWKGPAADAFWRNTEARSSRMQRASRSMRMIAEQMRRAARDIRHEEQQRRLARHR